MKDIGLVIIILLSISGVIKFIIFIGKVTREEIAARVRRQEEWEQEERDRKEEEQHKKEAHTAKLQAALQGIEYQKMLMISCYPPELGIHINEETRRLVYICANADETIDGITFDRTVWYEPRENSYDQKTRFLIIRNNAFRFCCDCYRSYGPPDRHNRGDGENSGCGSHSRADLQQVCESWLTGIEPVSCDSERNNHKREFIHDVRMILSDS
jgi:hypothetical protein